MPTAKLISITPDYMTLLKAACSKPYGKDVSDKAVQRIIASGHLSVLEHCYASFDVECSVRVLGQLTRHRHLSFTVKSARGSVFDKFVNPLDEVTDSPEGFMDDVYHEMIGEGYPEEVAAYYLPQGVLTNMVVTGNFRAWYEYLPKRLCKRAMPEHRELARLILQELKAAAPLVFAGVTTNCKACTESSCEFKHKKGADNG